MKLNFKRQPTTPGEILSEEFLKPMGLTQKRLADHLNVDIKVINRLINGRTSLSVEMALLLSATFKNSPDFWLNAQYANDLFEAKKNIKKLPRPIKW